MTTPRHLPNCFILASISIGLAVWVLLPTLFSLLIILALSYLDEQFIGALQVESDDVPQLKEAREQHRCEMSDSLSTDVSEALAVRFQ
jgi:hypothetical protein